MLEATVLGILVLAGTSDVTLVDRLGLLRIGPGQKQPLSVFSHEFAAGSSDCVGSLFASDAKVVAFTKKQLFRHAIAADRDGDGEDELLIVREKKKGAHALDLLVLRFPESINGDAGKVIASAPAFGNAKGDDRVVAVGAADVDPQQPGDELLIVREDATGIQSLAVHALPAAKKQPLGAPLRFDPDVAHAGELGVASLCGLDLDGDATDEIALLLKPPAGTGGATKIAFHAAPDAVTGELGPALADYADVAIPGFGLTSIGRAHLDTADRLLLFLTDGESNRRIEIHDPPAALGAALATPLASDATLGFGSSSFQLVAAIGHRQWFEPPPPDPTFEVDVPLYVVIAGSFSFGVTTDQVVKVKFDGSNFTLTFPGNAPVVIPQPAEYDPSGLTQVDVVPDVLFANFPATLNFQEGPLQKDIRLTMSDLQIGTIPETSQVTGFVVVGGGTLLNSDTTPYATIKYVMLDLP